MLVVILGGIRVWQRSSCGSPDRPFAGWIDAVAGRGLDRFCRHLRIDLPERHRPARRRSSPTRSGRSFWEVLSQPIIWLAVAALVFGSQVLSLAELWRKGQPYAAGARRDGLRAATGRKHRGPAARPAAARASGWPAGQLREAFLGDIDDKYLPTFHSLRLVLRAGVSSSARTCWSIRWSSIAQNYFSDPAATR